MLNTSGVRIVGGAVSVPATTTYTTTNVLGTAAQNYTLGTAATGIATTGYTSTPVRNTSGTNVRFGYSGGSGAVTTTTGAYALNTAATNYAISTVPSTIVRASSPQAYTTTKGITLPKLSRQRPRSPGGPQS